MKRHELMEKIVNERQCVKGAEIGVLHGGFTCHLLDTNPGLHMLAVDKWEQYPPDHVLGAFDMEALYQGMAEKAATYDSRLTVLRGASVEMARQVDDGSLDFVFIDAEHDSESVTADIEAWAPKVRAGGFVSGHDINWPSVHVVVSQVYPEFQTLADNVWLVEKYA